MPPLLELSSLLSGVGNPRREYFAIKDGGLHLNLEGSRRLSEFLINTFAHLK